MTTILDINDYQAQRSAGRLKKVWDKRFPEKLSAKSMMADLKDKTLLELALLSQEIGLFLYEAIMAALDIRPGMSFEDLDSKDKMRVLDVHLFVVDQIRWECLGRLGMVHSYAAEKYPLIELILNQYVIKSSFDPPFPLLIESHQNYQEFIRRRTIDGETMIRAMIPAAVAAFGARLGPS